MNCHIDQHRRPHRNTLAGFAIAFLAWIGYAPAGFASDPNDPGLAFFESSIRPVLVKHCYECHSQLADQAGNLEAGLLLDSKTGMRQGGDAGPAILPGDPENSLLIHAMRRDEDHMPPDGTLPAEVIDRFAKWIAMGAPDPRDGGANAPTPRRSAFEITDEDRAHWAFQPVHDFPPPNVHDSQWVRDDLDRFVLASHEAQDQRPNPPADRDTLLRRTTYALTGLPPTPAEIAAFANDEETEAFEAVVDRLLASQEFGKHWARHWLDGVRYADSIDRSGQYRDWVIRAFNDDLPYDEFVRLQLAGDLLTTDDSDPESTHVSGASLDGITATGMLTLAVWEVVGRDLAVAEIVDSQIDVVGRQFMGLTLACARCHDHKFDPISMPDYYGLAGIFFSSRIVTGKLIADNRLAEEMTEVALLNVEQAATNRRIDDEIATCEAQIATLEAAAPQALRLAAIQRQLSELTTQIEKTSDDDAREKLNKKAEPLRTEQAALENDQQENGWEANPPELAEIDRLREQIRTLRASKPATKTAVAARDGGVPGSSRQGIGDAPIYLRGEYQHPGPVVPRQFPAILAGEDQTPIGELTSQSGRRELAEWITSPDHPLTARVMVNRIWQQLIGEGLVRTPDNFGRLGESPTHPELLDHLTHRFVSSGWSVKELVREIVLSATFRQSSLVSQDAARGDPDNRLLARMNRRRLTYEELRDTVLLVSGQLALNGDDATEDEQNSTKPRTIFEPVSRKSANLTAAMFDFPDPKSIIAQRAETTTAPQALFLMNNQFVADAAERVSNRLETDPELARDDERLNRLWLSLLGRPPEPGELDEARSFLGRASWPQLVHALFATNEFMYLD